MRVAWCLLRARTLAVATLSLATLRACFIDIREPLDPDAGVGGSANQGGTGAAGTGAGVGGSSGTDGASGTSGASATGGTGGCDGGCGPQCTSCDGLPNATGACSAEAGACVIASCADTFVDCDGNVANGCETSFGPFGSGLGLGETTLDGGQAWLIPRLANPPSFEVNASGLVLNNWNEASSIKLDFACGTDCKSNTSPGDLMGSIPIQNPGAKPVQGDLEAYFRVGWYGESLFVLALVHDNELLRDASDAGSGPAAQRQDSLELFLDSLSSESPNYNPGDYHLFVGAVDGATDDPQRGAPGESVVGVTRQTLPSCYFIQAEFKPGSLTPAPRSQEAYGFSVGVNDWDTLRGTPRREHQVLWQSPGPQYGHRVEFFPRVQLQ